MIFISVSSRSRLPVGPADRCRSGSRSVRALGGRRASGPTTSSAAEGPSCGPPRRWAAAGGAAGN